MRLILRSDRSLSLALGFCMPCGTMQQVELATPSAPKRPSRLKTPAMRRKWATILPPWTSCFRRPWSISIAVRCWTTRPPILNLCAQATVKYKVMRRSEVTVRNHGCIAIINGIGNYDVRVKENDINVVLRFTSIWQKTDAGLQFVSWQSTRMP
jgi:hypothetical protein